MFETLAGNETKGVKGMTREQIIQPFIDSFASSDPAKGGCVDVPPCPKPCHPPTDTAPVTGARRIAFGTL